MQSKTIMLNLKTKSPERKPNENKLTPVQQFLICAMLELNPVEKSLNGNDGEFIRRQIENSKFRIYCQKCMTRL
jgi:hypothetical protein